MLTMGQSFYPEDATLPCSKWQHVDYGPWLQEGDVAYPLNQVMDTTNSSCKPEKGCEEPGCLYQEQNATTGMVVSVSVAEHQMSGGMRRYVVRVGPRKDLLSASYTLFDAPAVSWHPDRPHELTILVYRIHEPGAFITSYNVVTGHIVRSRHVPQVDADMGAVTKMTYSPDGLYLIVSIMEELSVNNYLTRILVLTADTFVVVSKSRAAMCQTCHTGCVWNIRPRVSRCGGYVCVPAVPPVQPIVHNLPPEHTLKHTARRAVLRTLPPGDRNEVSSIIQKLDIPKDLKSHLLFQ